MIENSYIDPILYVGRPKNMDGRLPREIRTYDLLDQLHIPYERLDHKAVFTIEGCQAIEQRLGTAICKNLFLCNAQKTAFYLLLMPGEKKFKTAILSKEINSSRLSFADEGHMEEFLDITPGSVSILGLMNDTANRVKLLIDEEVIAGHEAIGCHPCVNTSSLKIKTSDILDVFLPWIRHPYTLVHLPQI